MPSGRSNRFFFVVFICYSETLRNRNCDCLRLYAVAVAVRDDTVNLHAFPCLVGGSKGGSVIMTRPISPCGNAGLLVVPLVGEVTARRLQSEIGLDAVRGLDVGGLLCDPENLCLAPDRIESRVGAELDLLAGLVIRFCRLLGLCPAFKGIALACGNCLAESGGLVDGELLILGRVLAAIGAKLDLYLLGSILLRLHSALNRVPCLFIGNAVRLDLVILLELLDCLGGIAVKLRVGFCIVAEIDKRGLNVKHIVAAEAFICWRLYSCIRLTCTEKMLSGSTAVEVSSVLTAVSACAASLADDSASFVTLAEPEEAFLAP